MSLNRSQAGSKVSPFQISLKAVTTDALSKSVHSSFIWLTERVNPSSLHVADHREDDSAIGMRSVFDFEINFLATLAYLVSTFGVVHKGRPQKMTPFYTSLPLSAGVRI